MSGDPGGTVAPRLGRVDTFWRNVGVVLGGSVAAQAIPLLGSLAIARLFLPSTYGLFATWLGVVSVAAIIVTGRYEVALALEHDGEPRRVGMVSTVVLTAAGTIAGMGVLLLVLALRVLPAEQATIWLACVPAVVLTAIAQAWQSWAVADGRYWDVSAIRIVQAVTVTGAQIAAGFLVPTALSLALAQILGIACSVVFAAWRLPLSPAPIYTPHGRDSMRGFLSRHRRFPIFSLPADAVNTAASQLPLILVSSRFGLEAAGFVAMTMRILGGPISLLGSSVRDVFRRRAVESWRQRSECRDDYIQTFKVLAVAALAFTMVVGPFSEPLFVLAFSERWRMSGTIALWMLPLFALRFVASPLSYTMYVAGKQHVDLLWQVALLLLTLATLMLPPTFEGTVRTYSVGYGALYVVYLGMSYRYSLGALR